MGVDELLNAPARRARRVPAMEGDPARLHAGVQALLQLGTLVEVHPHEVHVVQVLVVVVPALLVDVGVLVVGGDAEDDDEAVVVVLEDLVELLARADQVDLVRDLGGGCGRENGAHLGCVGAGGCERPGGVFVFVVLAVEHD